MPTTSVGSKINNDDEKRLRSKIEINAKILDVCLQSGKTKSRIMFQANLSYEMVISYVNRLLKCRLLEVSSENSNSKLLLKTTTKGREYLHHYSMMEKLQEFEE